MHRASYALLKGEVALERWTFNALMGSVRVCVWNGVVYDL